MKFEVHYPGGSAHEIELQGTVATLGRDPTCDLVLNDVKCSRRHAVLEAGPQGIAIRDTGSANGVYVNGHKVERAGVREGDEIRLGEVILRVLAEEVAGTLVMGPEDVEAFGLHKSAESGRGAPASPRPSPAVATVESPVVPPSPGAPNPSPPRPAVPSPPAARVPRPPPPAGRPPLASGGVTLGEPSFQIPTEPSPARPRRPSPPTRAETRPRPVMTETPRTLTVTLLAALWGLSVLLYGGAALGVLVGTGGLGLPPWAPVAGAALFGFLASLSLAMAWGLWVRAAWARVLQIGVAALGAFSCLASLPSVAVLIYMFRPEARRQFSRVPDDLGDSPAGGGAETGFALAIVGTLALSVLGAAGTAFGVVMPQIEKARAFAQEARLRTRLRMVAAQQEAFRAGTCDGYANLEGLLSPAKVIPHYPASAPAFLPADFGSTETLGYRFELRVEDPLPANEGCPSASFRRYQYAADPVSGRGRHYVIGPDRVVHAAEGRPATLDDPPIE